MDTQCITSYTSNVSSLYNTEGSLDGRESNISNQPLELHNVQLHVVYQTTNIDFGYAYQVITIMKVLV